MSKLPVAFLLLFLTIEIQAQKYGPSEKYLIDDLNLEQISSRDKALIDSALLLYNKCEADTCRIQSISLIVEGSWDDQIWSKYNLWVRDFILARLDQRLDSLSNRQFQKFYASTLNNIGYLFNTTGQTDSALYYYDQCLAIQKNIDDKVGMSGTLINTAYIFLNQGLVEKALNYYYESLKIEEEIKNKSGIATALNAIGYIQYQQGDSKKALESYNRSLTIREELKEKYGIATCLNNIGLVFKDLGQLEKALEYYQKCLKIEEEISDKSGIAISYANIGFVHNGLGKLDEALKYYRQSLKIRENLKDKLGISQSLNSIASILLATKELENARIYAERSLKIAQSLEYPINIRDAALTLSNISRKQGDWKKATKYFEIYVEMRDSIFNEETIKSSIHQQYKYSYEKKALADSIENANQQKIKNAELAASEAEKQRLEILSAKQQEEALFLIFVLLSALALSALIYARMRVVKRQKVIVEQHKEELEYLNKDLEEFAHIISHDLKTPLHTITGLLYLIEEDFPDLEKDLIEKLKLIKDSSIESNALIDGVLSYSEAGRKSVNLTEVNVNTLINSIIGHLPNPNEISIKVTTQLPSLTCNEYQLYEIFSNLISNAIKYNHQEKGKGEITIGHSQLPNYYEFFVSDNGPGIPKNLQPRVFEIFQKGNHSKDIDSTGIGLSIVKKLVAKNEGTITLKSEEGKGSTFTFTLPL